MITVNSVHAKGTATEASDRAFWFITPWLGTEGLHAIKIKAVTNSFPISMVNTMTLAIYEGFPNRYLQKTRNLGTKWKLSKAKLKWLGKA